ncbi:MAG: FtsX-like permease family protein [Candidatus Riflebacteria bacterium]|nr:FtsX-like permease family protein [Candidatus Riflebacteria bacterium]
MLIGNGLFRSNKDFAVMRAIGARKRDIAMVVFMEAAIIAGVGLFIGFIMLAILLDNTAGSPILSYFPSYVAPVLAAVTLIVSLIGSLIALRTSLKADPAAVFH